MKRPNILYIHSHDTGRFIQPYGHPIATPRLQKLAEQGILFRQAFTANPTCSPSRACLLTGQSAHANGMLGLAHRGFSLHDNRRHIAHTLRKIGYETALSGVQHVARSGPEPWKEIGYDRFLGQPEEAHSAAAAYLDEKPQNPFFLSVGFFETHRKFPVDHPQDDTRYCLPPPLLPDTAETREDMARFKQSARILDHKIGVVLDALAKNRLADNTLVICTTDHGIAFPRMKCNLEDSGTGVMLILRGPDGFTGGKVTDCLVSQIDIYPTICDLLKIDRPDWLEGVSLLPLTENPTIPVRDQVFSEINYHAAFEPMRSIRTARWKYIRRYDSRPGPVLPNCDDGFSKQIWLQAGWQQQKPADQALYDLILDPHEVNNLASQPSHHEVLGEMQARLEHWMHETGDFLPARDVPLPASAMLNSRDGISPNQEKMQVGTR